jgi:hypothetical protein
MKNSGAQSEQMLGKGRRLLLPTFLRLHDHDSIPVRGKNIPIFTISRPPNFINLTVLE